MRNRPRSNRFWATFESDRFGDYPRTGVYASPAHYSKMEALVKIPVWNNPDCFCEKGQSVLKRGGIICNAFARLWRCLSADAKQRILKV